MKTANVKLITSGLFTSGLVLLAVLRLWPYISNERKQGEDIQTKLTTKVVVNTVVPKYNLEMTSDDVIELSDRIHRKVYAAILELPNKYRPSELGASSIAVVYADFVILNRTGSLQDILASYIERDIVVPHRLNQDDIVRATDAWRFSTAWAKHQPIDVDSIRVETVYHEGERVSLPRYDGNSIRARPMSDGNELVFGASAFTVYEVVIHVMAPNLDGRSEFAANICVSIINDGSNGEWDIVSTTWSEKEKKNICELPYP